SCQNEFKEYYIQMQAAKRSQAPHPSQLKDDSIILDKTLADQVSSWKSSRGLSDTVVTDHACSGKTCSYYQIGDEQQQGVAADEEEPFMGSGRFARAYLLGYNCADEKELEATLRYC
ncbi:F-box protein SKIP31, partial [Trifolium medium]|nr:F-box protein SKIP31 [Trifolium medium]